MKAIRQRRTGGPETLESLDVAAPACGDDQVLVDVRAVGLNPLDWKLMQGLPAPLRWLLPRIPPEGRGVGVDLAGTAAALGRNVTGFSIGQAVFGNARSALAQRVAADPSRLTSIPPGITFEEAAGVGVAGVTALQALRLARVRAHADVLINGASGGVGTFAVQLARAEGARVSGVCSARNADLARGLGCERVIDYEASDFTRDSARYDALIDCVGNRAARDLRRVVRPQGVGVFVGAPSKPRTLLHFLATTLIPGVFFSRFKGPRFEAFIAKSGAFDLEALADRMRDGKVKTVIERTFSFDEAREAFALAASERARGKVIVTL